jgi:hypothetical protein
MSDDIKRLTIEEECELLDSSPAEAFRGLSEAFASIKSNQDAIRDAGLSANKAIQHLYKSLKPVSPAFNKTALASMTAGLSKVALASKAVSTQFNYTGTSSAISKIGQSMARSSAIAETMRNHSSTTLKMIEASRKSVEVSSRALSASFERRGLTVPTEQLHTAVVANKVLPQSIPALPATAIPALQTSLASVIPKAPALMDGIKRGLTVFAELSLKVADWLKTSPIIEAATKAIGQFRNYLQKSVGPLLEKLRSIKPWAIIKKYGRKGLLYLRKLWLSRKRKPLPLDEESFRKAIALQPIGPATSFEFFEYADRIRHIHLRCHQRISEDTDDHNGELLLVS